MKTKFLLAVLSGCALLLSFPALGHAGCTKPSCSYNGRCYSSGSTVSSGGKCYKCSNGTISQISCPAPTCNAPNCRVGGYCASNNTTVKANGLCYRCSNGSVSQVNNCYCDGCPSGSSCSGSGCLCTNSCLPASTACGVSRNNGCKTGCGTGTSCPSGKNCVSGSCVAACSPRTCGYYPSGTCGSQSNGCGGTIDCGACPYVEVMRIKCPDGEDRIAGTSTAVSALKVRKGTTTYSVVLVDPDTDPNASCARVIIPGSATAMALRKCGSSAAPACN